MHTDRLADVIAKEHGEPVEFVKYMNVCKRSVLETISEFAETGDGDDDGGGFGLVGMRERVEAAGGEFTVESAPG
jgi:glucose-6-phosphate-specific signal transduction histidine kinase